MTLEMDVPQDLGRLECTDSELVLALVAPTGTRVSNFVATVKESIGAYGYQLREVKLSKLIQSMAEDDGSADKETAAERTNRLMTLGTELRSATKRNDVVALAAIRDIHDDRKRGDQREPLPKKKVVHLLDSLKHPDEVELLRRVYGRGLIVVALSSTREERVKHLESVRRVVSEEAGKLIDRDEKEGPRHGQRTRDTFHLADVFLTIDATDETVSRLLKLLFGDPFITPTKDEHFMFLAFATAMRSADLSRQVGAAIVSKESEVLALGYNDAPRFEGGLYYEGSDPDHRDFQIGGDTNSAERQKIFDEVVGLIDEAIKLDSETKEKITASLRSSSLSSLTEYGRAVHAEMEAILSCSRRSISCRGATLYTTTFPCHNCARHIVAAGIRRVVYVEPYPKSRALDLHKDSMGEKSNDGKVELRAFEGVGPRRFMDFFSMSMGEVAVIRKDDNGSKVEWVAGDDALLRMPMPYTSYLDREQIAVEMLVACLVDGGAG